MVTPKMKLDQEVILSEIFYSLEMYALADIKKTADQGLIVASFILCACFIDQLSHHRYYKIIKGPSDKFVAFVDEYFDGKYDSKKLCYDLRSRLVHNYSITENYSLSNAMPEWHLVTDEQGITWMNIMRFIHDIEAAYLKFKDDVINRVEARKAVLGHYKKYEVIRNKSADRLLG
jgi:hypothetical protein